MDYKKKYEEMTSGFYKCIEDISIQYPECNDFEKCVIALRSNGWTYGNIQKKLGMPAKKEISAVLNKWAPELIDNSKKREIKISNWESETYNIIKNHQNLKINLEDEDYIFYIKDNKLYYEDWCATDNLFSDLNEIMQQQFLIAIKDQIND